MKLTLPHLHLYLLDKGFVEPAALLEADYLATQMHTRNTIFQVIRRHGPSLFIKQLSSFDAQNSYVLQKEATCLWLIKNHAAFAGLAAYVPGYFGFDPARQVLVTEYVPSARNLDTYVQQHGSLPLVLREQLATLLASYHFPLGASVLSSRSVQFFPRQVPWVLTLPDLADAPGQLSAVSAANPAVSLVLGQAELSQALRASRAEWAATSLIHGDLKWVNLLAHRPDGDDGKEELKVIDWEIADIGDPLWDVAGVLHGFVTDLIFYHPAVAGDTLGLVPGLGLAHLEAAWPSMDQFWQLYRAQTTPDADPAAEAADLAKTLRYVAARLVQLAVEHNALAPTLQPNPTKLLQASYAILTNEPAILARFTAAPAVAFA